MKTAQLFALFPEYRIGDQISSEVRGIYRDSRYVESSGVYVAVKGYKKDGHDFILQAIENGATALVVEEAQSIPKHFSGAVAVVKNSRLALQKLASRYFGDPAQELFCVGVTGTNGKTTTCYMIEHVLQSYGWNVGVLGTIDHHLGDHHWESQLTTPDTVDLQKRLREFRALNAQASTFEVSSHALSQHRVEGVPFDVAIFTNLSRDHLDYHQNMENYFAAKESLFRSVLAASQKKEKFAVINKDDSFGAKIQVADGVTTFYYGSRDAEITFSLYRCDFNGSQFRLMTPRGDVEVHLKIPGVFNISNAMAAAGVGLAAGLSVVKIGEALSSFKGVPGRLQLVPTPQQQAMVFVDYAHTPDALEKVLVELNQVRSQSGTQNRIITIFGCGGDRDVGKRPVMGMLAEKYSDLVFVTSDNPRTEDPDKIIQDILGGMKDPSSQSNVFCDPDRKSAIGRALQMARSDDVILIAGKGHETYQIIGDQTLAFDDRQVVKDLIDGLDT